MQIWKSRLLMIVLLTVAGLPAGVWADPSVHPLLSKRLMLNLGGFFPDIDSKIRLDSDTGGIGTVIDFESQLGLEKTRDTFWLNGRWRISRRNSLDFEWVNLDRDATVAGITQRYDIGDTTIQAGGRIDSTFNLDIYRLTYGFSLLRSERVDLKLQAGLHVADVTTQFVLTGGVSINDQPFVQSVSTESGDVTAPLPHFGGNLTWAVNDRLALFAHLMGFALEINDIDGSIVDAAGTVQYNLTPNVGLGAGLRFFHVDVTSGDPDLRGKFEFDYFGPVVFASLSF